MLEYITCLHLFYLFVKLLEVIGEISNQVSRILQALFNIEFLELANKLKGVNFLYPL